MLRAVMAVTLATALLAVSMPAIDGARADRADASARAAAERIESAARDLQATDGAVPPGTAGARRVVTVRLPERTWTSERLQFLAVGGRPDSPVAHDRTAVAWQVPGRTLQLRNCPGIRLEHRDGDDDPLVLREPGRHRLVLRLVRVNGTRIVTVRRLGSESAS